MYVTPFLGVPIVLILYDYTLTLSVRISRSGQGSIGAWLSIALRLVSFLVWV